MESIIYVGMDVHKETYSLCCYEPKTDIYLYEARMNLKISNVLKYLENIKKKFRETL